MACVSASLLACVFFRHRIAVSAGFGVGKRAFMRGKWWGLVERGECVFARKAEALQKLGAVSSIGLAVTLNMQLLCLTGRMRAGASGMIIVNNAGGPERVGRPVVRLVFFLVS